MAPQDRVLPFGTGPIPLTDIPLKFIDTLTAPLTLEQIQATEEIKNRLSFYLYCVDGAGLASPGTSPQETTLQHLDRVFLPDASLNYSSPVNVLPNLEGLKQFLAASLPGHRLQHISGTALIKILGPESAFSVSYARAHHFTASGPVVVDKNEGCLSAYVQYQDQWVKLKIGEGWRIAGRNLVYMGPLTGNLAVMGATPEQIEMAKMGGTGP